MLIGKIQLIDPNTTIGPFDLHFEKTGYLPDAIWLNLLRCKSGVLGKEILNKIPRLNQSHNLKLLGRNRYAFRYGLHSIPGAPIDLNFTRDFRDMSLAIDGLVRLCPSKLFLEDNPEFDVRDRRSLDGRDNFLPSEVFDFYDHQRVREAMQCCLARSLDTIEHNITHLLQDIFKGESSGFFEFRYSLHKLEVCWDTHTGSPISAVRSLSIPLKSRLIKSQEVEPILNRCFTSGNKRNGFWIKGPLRKELELIAYAKAENLVRLESRYGRQPIRNINKGRNSLHFRDPIGDVFRLVDLVAAEESSRWEAIVRDARPSGEGAQLEEFHSLIFSVGRKTDVLRTIARLLLSQGFIKSEKRWAQYLPRLIARDIIRRVGHGRYTLCSRWYPLVNPDASGLGEGPVCDETIDGHKGMEAAI